MVVRWAGVHLAKGPCEKEDQLEMWHAPHDGALSSAAMKRSLGMEGLHAALTPPGESPTTGIIVLTGLHRVTLGHTRGPCPFSAPGLWWLSIGRPRSFGTARCAHGAWLHVLGAAKGHVLA
jgi:hypothetical protein